MNLILASASPRRREILASLGVSFEMCVADADESCDILHPGLRVEKIAENKCSAAVTLLTEQKRLTQDTLVLASDTLVTMDGVFLGKPKDTEDAMRMLCMLQGSSHDVVTGIALWYQGKKVTAHEMTRVSFAPMTTAEIERYVATGEPMGKAGAYAIQGHAARYITGIAGDYFNVVGLPVRRLYDTLYTSFGIEI